MVNLPSHKFHDKGTNGRLSPRKLYHMANVPPEGIPYGKPSPGNPIAELPQGNNTIWQAFPGRNPMAELPPLWQISSHTNSICNIATACAICFGMGGGEKSHRWGTFTIWYFIRGKEIHGGGGGSHVTPDSPYSGNMMYPQQKHQFHTIIFNHLSLEICLHVLLPVNLHITSANTRWLASV